MKGKKLKKGVFFLFSVLILEGASGCATWSNRTKTIVTSLAAGAIVGTAGALYSNAQDLAPENGFLWGTTATATTALVSLFIFDSEKEKQSLLESHRKLSFEIRELKASIEPQLIEEVSEGKLSHLPSEISKLVSPGVYRRYLIAPKLGGIWVKEKSGNTWFKRSQMLLYTKGQVNGLVEEALKPEEASLDLQEEKPLLEKQVPSDLPESPLEKKEASVKEEK